MVRWSCKLITINREGLMSWSRERPHNLSCKKRAHFENQQRNSATSSAETYNITTNFPHDHRKNSQNGRYFISYWSPRNGRTLHKLERKGYDEESMARTAYHEIANLPDRWGEHFHGIEHLSEKQYSSRRSTIGACYGRITECGSG
jgi:hypothetical protein